MLGEGRSIYGCTALFPFIKAYLPLFLPLFATCFAPIGQLFHLLLIFLTMNELELSKKSEVTKSSSQSDTSLATDLASKTRLPTLIGSMTSYWLEAGLLAAALLVGWLPVEWTRNLKRPVQAPNYDWLGLGYVLLYCWAAWWLWRKPASELRYRHRWLALVALVIIPNLFNIWIHYATPLSATDPRPLFGRDSDIGIYFDYGKDMMGGQWPVNSQGQFAEYPQLSLPLFWLGAVLSGANLETFSWVFPTIMVIFQFGAAAALYGLGLKLGRARAAFLLAAFVAGCPTLFLFSYTRFDVVPTACLLAGIYFAVPGDLRGVRGMAVRRRWRGWSALAGVLLAVGGLTKWLPGLSWPWLMAAYWRTRNRAGFWAFGATTVATGLILTLPLFLVNAPALLYPYQYQGSRKLIGESIWFLVQYHFFDPGHTFPEKPWGEPPTLLLDNGSLLALQMAVIGLVFGLALWRLWTVRNEREAFEGWAGAGLIGVALFTLTNRIFSPQYLILLAWVWAAVLILRPISWRGLAFGFALIGLAAGANFRVYLLGAYPEMWVRDSAIMFGAAFVLSDWLLVRYLKPSKS